MLVFLCSSFKKKMLGINLAFLKLLARFQPFMYRKHTVFLCLSPFLQILPIPGKIVYAEDLPCLVCWSEEGQEDETNLFLQQSCACGRESNAIQLSFLIPHIYIHICIYMNMSIYLRYDCSNQQWLSRIFSKEKTPSKSVLWHTLTGCARCWTWGCLQSTDSINQLWPLPTTTTTTTTKEEEEFYGIMLFWSHVREFKGEEGHLVEEYISWPHWTLYAAFIDYKMAFDSISWDRFWLELEASTIDHRLFALIHALYENNYLSVTCNLQGQLSHQVPVREVWSKCASSLHSYLTSI